MLIPRIPQSLSAEGLDTVRRAMTEASDPAKYLDDLERCRDNLINALADFKQSTLSAMRHLQPSRMEHPPSGETMRPPWESPDLQNSENPTDAVLQIYL